MQERRRVKGIPLTPTSIQRDRIRNWMVENLERVKSWKANGTISDMVVRDLDSCDMAIKDGNL